MNASIFSFVKTSATSIVASVRLARFIHDTLELPLIEPGDEISTGLDVLIIINGAFAFAGPETLAALGKAIETAKRVVWVQQDYTIIPPKSEGAAESPFRKAFRVRQDLGLPPVDYWTTCEPYAREGRTRTGRVCGAGSRYVNWNVLTFDEARVAAPVADRVHRDTLLYYGSYRADRVEFFTRYFKDPTVKTTISCPTMKFVYAGFGGSMITHTQKFSSLEEIGQYGLGLYLEDRMSSREFHSPANRFYEMLSAGLGMVFQAEAVGMMKKAGYNILPYVCGPDQLPYFMERASIVWMEQSSQWWKMAQAERASLPERLHKLWRSYVDPS